METVQKKAAIVAPSESTVLILGETGTGKELLARSIHAQSARSTRRMVSVNCAAIQPSLLASELFGHERGSFTGAFRQRPGRFEIANGGTIFLDEVGELPPEAQAALLRVLQEREFERVGGTSSIRVDVRVIVATNRDLESEVLLDRFRRDLFYRISVFPIRLPPLRARVEDIAPLVEHFLEADARRLGRKIHAIDDASLQVLLRHSWPGNVRELQNVIERWAVLSAIEPTIIDESWFARASLDPPGTGEPREPEGRVDLRERVAALERGLIRRAMAEVRGNRSEAAKRLGLSRGSLLDRLRKYGPMVEWVPARPTDRSQT